MKNDKYGQLQWDIICTGNEIMVSDTGIKIKELYGGFGQGQKILTIPQIAELHSEKSDDKKEIQRKIQQINELINNNIILDSGDKYFEFGIDIIDLKSDTDSNGMKSCVREMIKSHVYTQNSVNKAKNLYILSEQGYSLLINLMRDTKSKVIYKSVIRDYFRMKEMILGKDDAEQYMLRLLGKKERKKTTDSIKYYIDRGDFPWHNPKDARYNAYARETNYIYKLLFNRTAQQIKDYLQLNLKDYDTVRNYLCAKDIDDIRDVEGRVGYMQEDGKSFDEIHSRLKQLYPTPRSPRVADKNISVIKRLMAEQ